MRVISGGNYSYTRVGFRGFAYPIVIDEDTTFVGANFTQAEPHTDGIFSVAPGVTLRLERCNLKNVKVPDGAEVEDGVTHHAVTVETGNPDRPTVDLGCECERCAAAPAVFESVRGLSDAEKVAAGVKAVNGRWVHARADGTGLKARFRARREDGTALAADRTRVAAENEALASRWGATIDAATRTRVGRGR